MKETYWLSLNRVMPSPGPPPQPPLPHAPKEPLRTTNSGLSPGYLALSIVLPCVVLALAVGIAMRYVYMQPMRIRSLLAGKLCDEFHSW